MKEGFYNLLGIAKNSTDYGIYRAFSNLIICSGSFDELINEFLFRNICYITISTDYLRIPLQ